MLFSVKRSTVVSGSPFGSSSIITSVIAFDVIIGRSKPLSIFLRVTELTIETVGALI